MSTLSTFIVEDSPVILDSLVAMLEDLTPVKVVGTAADESEAVRWIHAPPQPFELMIVDVVLRSGSGLGVLRSAQLAALPVRRVVLTNFANPDIRKRCVELGAERVFDKSRELDELIGYCLDLAGDEAPGPPATAV